jgi:2-hydroxycyclohexanecarboxyl-CoA dehydrogenase
MGDLSGRTVLVTGSGRGIGRAIAERVAAGGADLAIHDLDWTAPAKYGEAADLDAVVAALERHGTRVVAVSGNIGDRERVAAMQAEIAARLGPVDTLINCAGGDIGAAGGKPNPNTGLDIAFEDIQTLVNNNLVGTVLMCQAFIPAMKQRGRGSVVNIASAAAHIGVSPEVIYSTLKAAVVHYTRCMAAELRPFGVRVNAVSPGGTKTARFVATRTVDPERMTVGTSLERYAEPAEIADVVAFLASDQARFVNGQTIRVDGGSTLFA